MAHAEPVAPDQFFSLSLDVFSEAGSDGCFQRLDPAFTRAFGYAEADLLGAPFIPFVHLEDRAATRAELEKLSRGEPSPGLENRFRRRDGTYRWLAWTAVPTPEGLVHAAARDITARRLAKERADAPVALGIAAPAVVPTGDFLVAVSHDLQQPLALIKGQVQLIQRQIARGQELEAARLEQGLGFVNAAVIRMRGMLQEMLDNALEQAGQPLGLLLCPTDLVALTRDTVSEHRLAFDVHQFVVDAEPTDLWALVDGPRIQRVLENLLSNAVKYSPAGGVIRVTVNSTADNTCAVIAVHDSGLGIPAADLPHIFDRFYRGANVVGCIAGNGLGLAGARQMVELHSGAIGVQSEEGRGSTFTMRLPIGSR
ncbi:MAG TPA: PAS domain-containing sensor histidine kinase [Chloroflexota bacterium]|nr:PAS domain-containing sensor histidine kinase [Chloroflexota bacterium]